MRKSSCAYITKISEIMLKRKWEVFVCPVYSKPVYSIIATRENLAAWTLWWKLLKLLVKTEYAGGLRLGEIHIQLILLVFWWLKLCVVSLNQVIQCCNIASHFEHVQFQGCLRVSNIHIAAVLWIGCRCQMSTSVRLVRVVTAARAWTSMPNTRATVRETSPDSAVNAVSDSGQTGHCIEHYAYSLAAFVIWCNVPVKLKV